MTDLRLTPEASDLSIPHSAELGCVLLAGTAMALNQLQAMLAAQPTGAKVVGCLLTASATAERPEVECPVLGTMEVEAVDRVLEQKTIDLCCFSLPASMAGLASPVAQRLAERGIPWRWIPTLADQLSGRVRQLPGGSDVSLRTLQESVPATWVEGAFLLQRQLHPIDKQAVGQVLAGRCVLITGSGGSIGSELARQVAGFGPKKLILVERSENALFEIDRQIARLFPGLARAAVLHDVTNATQTLNLLKQHRPQVIFHAAAHKHVPMMEEHPAQALENNFFGTRSIADAAAAVAAERFVMISTDKAVNPSSVMGASKRLAELYIQYLNARSDTRFCMVRFGNVLGSACSVLPIWQEQLAHGGPITVTHPEMQRYFMTIPEAAGLVLQSAAFTGIEGATGNDRGDLRSPAKQGDGEGIASPSSGGSKTSGGGGCGGGEVFLLDMGEPVRILDLARRFLHAQGLRPDVDVGIEFSGIRPGEKLFEELAYDGEDMIPTPHQSVRIWRSSPPRESRMQAIIATFDQLRNGGGRSVEHPWQLASRQAILDALHQAVPEMVQPASAAMAGAAPIPLPAARRAAV